MIQVNFARLAAHFGHRDFALARFLKIAVAVSKEFVVSAAYTFLI